MRKSFSKKWRWTKVLCCSCSFFPFDINVMEMLCYVLVLFWVSYVLWIPDWDGCLGLPFIQYFEPLIMAMCGPNMRIQINRLPFTGSAFDLYLFGLNVRVTYNWNLCLSLKILSISLFHTCSFIFQFLTTFSWFFRLEKTIIDSVLSVFDKVN